jgi:membrane fusion protein, multidrug efflux system
MDTRVEFPPKPDVTTRPKKTAGRRAWPWLLLLVFALAALVVWRQPWKPSSIGAGFPSPMGGPPGGPAGQSVQSVGVAIAAKGDVPITLTSLGTVTSLATVTVKSQISGYLTEIHFREGQTVKKGDLLAQVDPRSYEALLAQYQGQLDKDQALLDNARLDLERYQRLIKQDSTSKQTVDTAAATVRQYEGTVRADQALVDTQKLNLSYCRIVSSTDGRVGLRQVDAGNYVTASDSSGIVVVTQTTPISVVFTLPEDRLRQVAKRVNDGAMLRISAYDRANADKLADGTLDSIDNQIDTTTGTVKLRAQFSNADGSLFPNQFVNVRLLVDTLRDAVTVPTAAVQTGTPGTFVYRVNADNTVSLRRIVNGPSANGRVAVLLGLEIGEKVVVDGVDHLSDGAKVRIPNSNDTPAGTGKIP